MVPKKYVQTSLKFGPVANFPDNRREGAVVVPDPTDRMVIDVDAQVPEVAPHKKPNRVLSFATKNEIANFRASHTMAETRAQFLEVCERTIRRIAKCPFKYQEAKHKGMGGVKMQRPLMKYKALGEKLHAFFVLVRDADFAGAIHCLPSRRHPTGFDEAP